MYEKSAQEHLTICTFWALALYIQVTIIPTIH